MKFSVLGVQFALCVLLVLSDALPTGGGDSSGSGAGPSGRNVRRNIYGCSDSQFAEYLADFDKVDTDNDGKLSRENIRSLLLRMGRTITEGQLDGVMQLVDKNGDGVIDFDEYMAWVACLDQNDDTLRGIYNTLKDENDGISPNCFGMFVWEMGGTHTAERMKILFDKLDLDNDGLLNFEEFKPFLKEITKKR